MQEESPMNNEQLTKLIADKVTAEEADSGWVIAMLMLRMIPNLERLVHVLMDIRDTAALDKRGEYLTGELRVIRHTLDEAAEALLKKFGLIEKGDRS
jgi:hypothetical protein